MPSGETSAAIGARRRVEIMKRLRAFIDAHGYAPSVRELVVLCEYNSTAAVAHQLVILEKEGRITRQPGLARSIVITEKTP